MTHSAGIVGVGGVGRRHATALADTDGVRLTAIADVSGETLAAVGAEYGVPEERRYTDHEAMLAEADLDVVSVASPTYLHADHVHDAVTVGDPTVVWCEKPIAGSVADAESMVDACEAAGTELVVNHVRRWDEPYVRLREAVEAGALGDVQTVNAQFKLELLRNGTHYLDTVAWILGERAVRASGHLTRETPMHDRELPVEVDDGGGGGYVVFEDGTFLTLDCVVPRDSYSGWFVFTGSGGRWRVSEGEETATYWAVEDGEHVPEQRTLFPEGWDRLPDSFARAAENVVALADGTGENRSPGHEAVHVQEMLTALFVSGYTGSDVTLPLDGPLRDVSITSW
jgi:predicted dehydrogenase